MLILLLFSIWPPYWLCWEWSSWARQPLSYGNQHLLDWICNIDLINTTGFFVDFPLPNTAGTAIIFNTPFLLLLHRYPFYPFMSSRISLIPSSVIFVIVLHLSHIVQNVWNCLQDIYCITVHIGVIRIFLSSRYINRKCIMNLNVGEKNQKKPHRYHLPLEFRPCPVPSHPIVHPSIHNSHPCTMPHIKWLYD
jgi:hypothetical protein